MFSQVSVSHSVHRGVGISGSMSFLGFGISGTRSFLKALVSLVPGALLWGGYVQGVGMSRGMGMYPGVWVCLVG